MKRCISVIRNSKNLCTSREEVRRGFIELALEKSRRAEPFIEEAKMLRALASSARRPQALWEQSDIRAGLLAAAGLSDKAQNHLTADDKKHAFSRFCEECLASAGKHFADELVYRFLLTRGDTLGGQMRNLGGRLGKRKLNRSILAALDLGGRPAFLRMNDSAKWREYRAPEDGGAEEYIKGLRWQTDKGEPRTLIHDLSVPISQTNVDLCLFSGDFKQFGGAADAPHRIAGNYLALGELKSGIDPAGADEHWKTANTALMRIRDKFEDAGHRPATFFVGAAIEAQMAKEIFHQLRQSKLSWAANLTNDLHLAELCRWLVSI